MIAELFDASDEVVVEPDNYVSTGEDADVEAEMWRALGMDELSKKVEKGSLVRQSHVFMGTGFTVGGCYMCNNSATSAYCNPPMCPR